MDRTRQPAGKQTTPTKFPPEVGRVLSSQSGIGSLRQRLRELKVPIWGSNAECCVRDIEWDAKRKLRKRAR